MANLLTSEHLFIILGTAAITLALTLWIASLTNKVRLRKLLEGETKLHVILDNSVDAIGMSTKAGVVAFVNPAYVTLFGYDHEDELVGKPVLDLIAPEERQEIIQNIRLRGTNESAPKFYETQGLRKDGTTFDMDVHVSTFELHGERYTMVIERDITERKQAEYALEQQNRALQILHKVALDIGSDLETDSLLNQILRRGAEFFVADRGGGIYLYDAEQKILRLEAGSEINKNRIGTIVQLNEGVAGRVFQSAQPLIVNDYTNWEGHATVLISSPSSAVMGVPLIFEGKVFGVLTMVANSEQRTFTLADVQLAEMFAAQAAITIQNTKLYEQAQHEIGERKQAEEREREQRTLADALRATAEVLNSSLELDEILNKIMDNVEKVVQFDAMNIAWLEDDQVSILRYRGYPVGHMEDTIFNSKFPSELFPSFVQVIKTCQPVIIPEVQNSPLWNSLPKTEWVRSYITAPIIIDNKVAGTLNLDSKTPGLYTEPHARNLQIFANQVAIAVQNAQLYQKVQYAANYDALTGIPNRRKFMHDTRKELQRAKRYQSSVSFVMMDADHFKKINDTYGHPTGDQALVHLAQILSREIRASDLVGRYGGEEFMLLFPETSLDGARIIADRIRKTIMDTPVVVDGRLISFTVSMGLVSNEHGKVHDLETVLKQADKLLYQAKQSGRNRVMTIFDHS